MNIDNILTRYNEDIDSMLSWCDKTYESIFDPHFQRYTDLANRLNDAARPLSDSELEWILTDLPMDLFDVSEKISQLHASQQVVKLRAKYDSTQSSDAREELEGKIVIAAYDYLLLRVEKQVSYLRELIMGAKKVWDSRRRTESANPVTETPKEEQLDGLPDYVPKEKKAYIR